MPTVRKTSETCAKSLICINGVRKSCKKDSQKVEVCEKNLNLFP